MRGSPDATAAVTSLRKLDEHTGSAELSANAASATRNPVLIALHGTSGPLPKPDRACQNSVERCRHPPPHQLLSERRAGTAESR